MSTPNQVPKALKERYEAIVALVDSVCAELSLDEYAEMARTMTATLARKRPSPLATGTVRVWACSILNVLGRINFLFDTTQTPHLRQEDLCAAFNVSPSTAGAKAKTIIDLLNTTVMDPEWTLPSRLAGNPMAWMIELSNGLVIDVRYAPRELQEQAYQLGLIPFIPTED